MEHEVFAISLTAVRDSAAAAGGDSQFIAGPENRLAASAIDWLLHPGQHGYSPLVLHGPSGTGKSHLAQAVARSHNNATCAHAADFARELADAIDTSTVVRWRSKYRSAEMLVFEDLTQIANRPAAQTELLHTLDELAALQVPVVITSRLAPAEIAQFSPALRSRLAAGLEVPLSPPGPAALKSIVLRLAADRGIRLSAGAVQLLTTGLYATVPELRGILLELETAVPQPAGKGLVISTQRVRRFLAAHRARLRPNLQKIASCVARYFGLKRSQLCGASRRQQVALARSVAIYIGRQLTGKSLQALGKYFGDRDHTTILHSYRTLEAQLACDRQLRSTVMHLRKLLMPAAKVGEYLSDRCRQNKSNHRRQTNRPSPKSPH